MNEFFQKRKEKNKSPINCSKWSETLFLTLGARSHLLLHVSSYQGDSRDHLSHHLRPARLRGARRTPGSATKCSPTTYVDECGDGALRGEHLLPTQVCHLGAPTWEVPPKPVGKHFRLAGHEPHTKMVTIPIEKVSDKELFLRKARES